MNGKNYRYEVGGAPKTTETPPPVTITGPSESARSTLADLGTRAADLLPGLKGPSLHRFLVTAKLASDPAAFETHYEANKAAIDQYIGMISVKKVSDQIGTDVGLGDTGTFVAGLLAGGVTFMTALALYRKVRK